MDHSIRERRNDETQPFESVHPGDTAVINVQRDPDAYMIGEPPTPLASDVASIPQQRIHPKLGNLRNLLVAIKAGVGRLGFPGLPGLRIERKVYGALLEEFLVHRDPSHGPLLEEIQTFLTGVCNDIDDLLDPRRQPDLLEQPSSSRVEVVHEMPEARDLNPPASSGAGGDSVGRCPGGKCLQCRIGLGGGVGFCSAECRDVFYAEHDARVAAREAEAAGNSQ